MAELSALALALAVAVGAAVADAVAGAAASGVASVLGGSQATSMLATTMRMASCFMGRRSSAYGTPRQITHLWYDEGMADQDRQMCLSCSVKPATTSSGTVPMCSDCKRLMTNPRGVTYGDKKDRPKQAAAT